MIAIIIIAITIIIAYCIARYFEKGIRANSVRVKSAEEKTLVESSVRWSSIRIIIITLAGVFLGSKFQLLEGDITDILDRVGAIITSGQGLIAEVVILYNTARILIEKYQEAYA